MLSAPSEGLLAKLDLLELEGLAAKTYFAGFFELLNGRHDFDVTDRNRRVAAILGVASNASNTGAHPASYPIPPDPSCCRLDIVARSVLRSGRRSDILSDAQHYLRDCCEEFIAAYSAVVAPSLLPLEGEKVADRPDEGSSCDRSFLKAFTASQCVVNPGATY